MSNLFWLAAAQMRQIEPYFPLAHGVPRVDDRRIVSGIIIMIRNGLRWRDAPSEYGHANATYNRFIRWNRSAGILKTSLRRQLKAASLLKKGMFPDVSEAPKAG